MRVLKWIVERCQGRAGAVEGPLGWMPRREDLEWRGLDLDRDAFDALMAFDRTAWMRELDLHRELFARIDDRLPAELRRRRDELAARVERASQPATA
jgi:phosphoenolpyruvate carboxykinase (GTP)